MQNTKKFVLQQLKYKKDCKIVGNIQIWHYSIMQYSNPLAMQKIKYTKVSNVAANIQRMFVLWQTNMVSKVAGKIHIGL